MNNKLDVITTASFEQTPNWADRWEDLLTTDNSIDEILSLDPDAAIIHIFTSGTTGEPKGIILENYKYISSAFSYSNMCEYDDKTKIYHCLPMFYNAGMMNIFFSGISSGSNVVIGPRVNPINLSIATKKDVPEWRLSLRSLAQKAKKLSGIKKSKDHERRTTR